MKAAWGGLCWYRFLFHILWPSWFLLQFEVGTSLAAFVYNEWPDLQHSNRGIRPCGASGARCFRHNTMTLNEVFKLVFIFFNSSSRVVEFAYFSSCLTSWAYFSKRFCRTKALNSESDEADLPDRLK